MEKYLPIAIIVLSNTVYHICAKSSPNGVNPFASLSITYGVSTALCLLVYFITQKGGNLLGEYRQLNWSSFALGFTLVGLEAGFLYLYKAGWNISKGQLICSAILAIVLIFVGYLFYKEAITVSKLVGIGICLVGLYFINR